MENNKNYIKENKLELIIIILLIVIIITQLNIYYKIEENVFYYELNNIQDDLNAIKDRLDIY